MLKLCANRQVKRCRRYSQNYISTLVTFLTWIQMSKAYVSYEYGLVLACTNLLINRSNMHKPIPLSVRISMCTVSVSGPTMRHSPGITFHVGLPVCRPIFLVLFINSWHNWIIVDDMLMWHPTQKHFLLANQNLV